MNLQTQKQWRVDQRFGFILFKEGEDEKMKGKGKGIKKGLRDDK